eukprot:1160508-Pelagomonas_calceolata.AAC.6
MHGCQDSKENEASRQELGNRNPEQASKIDKQSSSRAPPLGCPEPLQVLRQAVCRTVPFRPTDLYTVHDSAIVCS